jgi:condensin complex subunit 3
MEEDNRDEQEGERDDEENNASIIVEENEEDEMETVSSRFVEQLLRHLLRGFPAEKLSVRTRCCQIIALSISSMGEIE